MTRNYFSLCLSSILACLVTRSVANESILGGHTAGVDQFPYQVSLKNIDHDYNSCGGAIIASQFVLTAAHCVIGHDNNLKPVRLHVLVGTNDVRGRSVRTVIARINKFYLPKEYNNPPQSALGDIAVLRLTEPLKLESSHKYIKKVDLPTDKHETYSDEKAIIAGFGYTWVDHEDFRIGGGHNDSLLHYAHADVLKSDKCHELLSHFKMLPKKLLCARVVPADDASPQGICVGDSGGALVHGNTVIGVLNAGPNNCDERYNPSVYARVTEYLDFIHDAMRDKTKNLRWYKVDW